MSIANTVQSGSWNNTIPLHRTHFVHLDARKWSIISQQKLFQYNSAHISAYSVQIYRVNCDFPKSPINSSLFSNLLNLLNLSLKSNQWVNSGNAAYCWRGSWERSLTRQQSYSVCLLSGLSKDDNSTIAKICRSNREKRVESGRPALVFF